MPLIMIIGQMENKKVFGMVLKEEHYGTTIEGYNEVEIAQAFARIAIDGDAADVLKKLCKFDHLYDEPSIENVLNYLVGEAYKTGLEHGREGKVLPFDIDSDDEDL